MARSGHKTPKDLSTWDYQGRTPPPPDDIREIHVYDFDNTLFCTPLPNQQIWQWSTIGNLQKPDYLLNAGSWWHNPSILAATGNGFEAEKARAWSGFWNEKIVELVRMSMADRRVVTILMTGRQRHDFSNLIQDMVVAKGLEFDMVALQPEPLINGKRARGTLLWKQDVLCDLLDVYSSADVRLYDDRIKHVEAFRDFFEQKQAELADNGPPFEAHVIHVPAIQTTMQPSAEIAEVQNMINKHNQTILSGKAPTDASPYRINRQVFCTGYMISPEDSARLKAFLSQMIPDLQPGLRFFADSVTITHRSASQSILQKVGGIGQKVRWRLTGFASHRNRLWAVRVAPVPQNTKVFTENTALCVLLALAKDARAGEVNSIASWEPISDHMAIEFDSTVGEKVILRIDKEDGGGDRGYNPRGAKRLRDEDFPPLGSSATEGSENRRPNEQGNAFTSGKGGSNHYGHRGGSNGSSRGNPRFGGDRGRGRGSYGSARGRGKPSYRSRDDSGGKSYGGGTMPY